MSETIIVNGDGITVDLLLWRRHGRRGQSLLEETLALNPGLAGLGPILPVGSVLALPDLPRQVRQARQPVSLFG